MDTLYKYYSSLPKNYLTNPTIRLTPPTQLNDPFEGIISKDIQDHIINTEELFNELKKYSNIDYNKEVKTRILLERALNNCGIASFSETQRNLLMWAHYANNHKGICIGYSSDLFLDPKIKDDYKDNKILVHTNKPIRVKYDSCRVDFNSHKFTEKSSKSIIFDILAHVMTLKGNDWIYEKEHRLIAPLNYADRIIFKKNGESITLEINEKKNFHYDKNHYLLFDENQGFEVINKDENFLILKTIKKESIQSIFLGCNMCKEDKENIIQTIKNNIATLGHIKVYDSIASKNNFELTQKLIDIK